MSIGTLAKTINNLFANAASNIGAATGPQARRRSCSRNCGQVDYRSAQEHAEDLLALKRSVS